MTVSNLAELDALANRVKKAQQIFATYTQEQVDLIFRNARSYNGYTDEPVTTVYSTAAKARPSAAIRTR